MPSWQQAKFNAAFCKLVYGQCWCIIGKYGGKLLKKSALKIDFTWTSSHICASFKCTWFVSSFQRLHKDKRIIIGTVYRMQWRSHAEFVLHTWQKCLKLVNLELFAFYQEEKHISVFGNFRGFSCLCVLKAFKIRLSLIRECFHLNETHFMRNRHCRRFIQGDPLFQGVFFVYHYSY